MSEQFIPGVYNYCDRWCERCAFTSRCRVYENTDNFTKAIEMLHEFAAEQGIDLENAISPEEMQVYEKKRQDTDASIKKSKLIVLCKDYQNLALPFVREKFSEELVSKTRTLHKHLHLGLETPETLVHTMATLGDCGDVIQWYLFFIEVKLRRALSQRMEGDEPDDFPKDSDGSAKIAIIAIERSMGAWARLLELLPDTEDVALQALSLLSKIKSEAVLNFPEAMQFVRPGFDD